MYYVLYDVNAYNIFHWGFSYMERYCNIFDDFYVCTFLILARNFNNKNVLCKYRHAKSYDDKRNIYNVHHNNIFRHTVVLHNYITDILF